MMKFMIDLTTEEKQELSEYLLLLMIYPDFISKEPEVQKEVERTADSIFKKVRNSLTLFVIISGYLLYADS